MNNKPNKPWIFRIVMPHGKTMMSYGAGTVWASSRKEAEEKARMQNVQAAGRMVLVHRDLRPKIAG